MKDWNKIENGASITLKDWEELKMYIWKLHQKIEELTKSRENWKQRYREK